MQAHVGTVQGLRGDRADRGSHVDGLTGGDGGRDRFVGGQQIAVPDADDALAGNCSGERDDPGTRRAHRLSGGRGEVGAAMAGQPVPLRRRERPHHHGPRIERPHPPPRRRRRPDRIRPRPGGRGHQRG
ncbi:hypothetical protein GCM10023205_54740 [Yinghuangia aomiensis]|uniref:Uncharacterized protein n=1 Tax=Yinghuangia aomiensis TaxID=676205 RepID=A0ABP9HUU7_9ACTN